MELGNLIISIFFGLFFIAFTFAGGTKLFAILILDYDFWEFHIKVKWWNYIVYPLALLALCILSPLIMFIYGFQDDVF